MLVWTNVWNDSVTAVAIAVGTVAAAAAAITVLCATRDGAVQPVPQHHGEATLQRLQMWHKAVRDAAAAGLYSW